MFKFAVPTILIGLSFAGFFMFTSPLYSKVNILKEQVSSYDQALNNSKALEAERDKLTKIYNDINAEDLSRIEKFLPDNVDNIRLILEIEKLALPYGMILKDVKYDTTTQASVPTAAQNRAMATVQNKDYGAWDLEFSVQGSYGNFLNFIKDLQNNLRIVDISSIQFSSETGTTGTLSAQASNAYKYSFKIKTYWLKN